MKYIMLYLKALLVSASDGINGSTLSALALLVLKVAGVATCSWVVVACYFLVIFIFENVRASL